jgi:hypothetical protein
MRSTAASRARERAGFTLAEAAKWLEITPRHLRRLELHGFSWYLANRARRLYGCSLNDLIGPGPFAPVRVRPAAGTSGRRPGGVKGKA